MMSNRVRLHFDKELSTKQQRQAINRKGWNFSRANTCWQRKISPHAIEQARAIANALNNKQPI